MSLQLVYLIADFILAWNWALATKHCPALSVDFPGFGVDDCKPSFTINTPDNIKDFLEDAKCKGYGQWDIPSVYGCKSPPITEGIEIDFPCGCDFGAECHVKCDHNYKLIGSDTIVCQENGSYSELPRCEKKKCPPPKLSPLMKLDPNCKSEEGDNCTITCATPDYRMYGSPFILCDHDDWSQIPICRKFCQVSQIPSSLKANGSCEGNENEFCEVSCRNTVLTLNGLHAIQCLPGGKWSSFPTCGCSDDDLPHGVHVEEDCKMVANEYCDANCGHHGNYPKGNNQRMFCNSEGKWDLTNPSTIDCWKECDAPSLPDGVVFTVPCEGAQVGQECQVKCQNRHMRLTGSDKFHCLRTGKYSGIPACVQKKQCSRSLVSPTVKLSDDCSAVIDEECPVSCKNPKAVLQGPSSIKCLESGSWNADVDCVLFCPPFPDVKEYQPVNCQHIRENSNCDVTCKSGYIPTHAQHVKCLEGGKWPDELPKCAVNCGFPSLKNGVTLRGCTYNENDTCELYCIPFHSLIPRNITEIKCLPNGKWTDGPECRKACNIRLGHATKLLDSCAQPLVLREVCGVECRNSRATLQYARKVTCTNRGLAPVRGRTPRCVVVKPCQAINFSRAPHLSFENECKNIMPPEGICPVKCKDSRAQAQGALLCGPGSRWTRFPFCVLMCPQMQLVPGTRVFGRWSQVEGSVTKVKCNSPTMAFFPQSTAKNIVKQVSVKCQNGAWPTMPACSDYCSEPSPIPHSSLGDDCVPKVGNSCTLKCDPNHMLVRGSVIQCTATGWITASIACVEDCPMASFENHPYMQWAEDCPYDAYVCKIKCNSPATLKGDDTIRCEAHGNSDGAAWQISGSCVL